MNLLLDTQVVIWMATGDRRIDPLPAELLAPDVARHLSSISVWEISIKWQRGKLHLPTHPREWTTRVSRELGLQPLAIRADHAAVVADLPGHHRDPFDRMLVAQAQVERFTLVTADPEIQKYEVDLLTL